MKLSTRGKFKRGENRSADEEAIREEKRTWDKYHTVESEVNRQRFPLSAMKRDKAHGDTNPSIMVTDRGGDSGVHGSRKDPE